MHPNTEANAEKAYHVLRGASHKFEVYRRASIPPGLHYESARRAFATTWRRIGLTFSRAHPSILSLHAGQNRQRSGFALSGYSCEVMHAQRSLPPKSCDLGGAEATVPFLRTVSPME